MIIKTIIVTNDDDDQPMVVIYPELKSEFVEVTPELAAEWLQNNEHGRRQRPYGIDAYSRDMSSGEWLVTGEAIKFDKYGRLIDGQHRLEGVVRAGKSIVTLVVWGLEPEARDRMDSGIPRAFKDQLTHSKVPHADIVAGVTRRVLLWDPPHNERVDFSRRRLTHAELERCLVQHPEILECTEFVASLTGGLNVSRSLRTFIYWVLRGQNEGMAQEFMTRLLRGSGLDEDDPIWVLREKLLAEQRASVKRGQPRGFQTLSLWLTMYAWNHWMDDRRVQRIQLPRRDIISENFPNLRRVKKITENSLLGEPKE